MQPYCSFIDLQDDPGLLCVVSLTYSVWDRNAAANIVIGSEVFPFGEDVSVRLW